jgi:hypothetical protein
LEGESTPFISAFFFGLFSVTNTADSIASSNFNFFVVFLLGDFVSSLSEVKVVEVFKVDMSADVFMAVDCELVDNLRFLFVLLVATVVVI